MTDAPLTSLPVGGYTSQTESAVTIVNGNKVMEEYLLRRLDFLPELDPATDMRLLAIARTHFQEGFMAMNRAIFRPKRLNDDELEKLLNQ